MLCGGDGVAVPLTKRCELSHIRHQGKHDNQLCHKGCKKGASFKGETIVCLVAPASSDHGLHIRGQTLKIEKSQKKVEVELYALKPSTMVACTNCPPPSSCQPIHVARGLIPTFSYSNCMR
jgi:hypothetical protein